MPRGDPEWRADLIRWRFGYCLFGAECRVGKARVVRGGEIRGGKGLAGASGHGGGLTVDEVMSQDLGRKHLAR